MDAEGYVKITGRIKDMIIRGGENVYPREIEEFLYSHPDIQEVQVFGVPDAKYGEQVAALRQVRDGSALTPKEIGEYCAGQIHPFQDTSLHQAGRRLPHDRYRQNAEVCDARPVC